MHIKLLFDNFILWRFVFLKSRIILQNLSHKPKLDTHNLLRCGHIAILAHKISPKLFDFSDKPFGITTDYCVEREQ